MAHVQQMKTMDQLQAGGIAQSWIEGMVRKYGLERRPPGTEITCEDGVTTLWRKDFPIALAVMQRDEQNWTVLTLIETEIPAPVEAGAAWPRQRCGWWRSWVCTERREPVHHSTQCMACGKIFMD